jgi:hypothetical protein
VYHVGSIVHNVETINVTKSNREVGEEVKALARCFEGSSYADPTVLSGDPRMD